MSATFVSLSQQIDLCSTHTHMYMYTYINRYNDNRHSINTAYFGFSFKWFGEIRDHLSAIIGMLVAVVYLHRAFKHPTVNRFESS